MRDLKHLIYFENLLQEANNELVQQAKAEGKYALGYTCYFMPEVLLDLPGCFSVRLRAPNCASPDMATYYRSTNSTPSQAYTVAPSSASFPSSPSSPLRRKHTSPHPASG